MRLAPGTLRGAAAKPNEIVGLATGKDFGAVVTEPDQETFKKDLRKSS